MANILMKKKKQKASLGPSQKKHGMLPPVVP
jgi:hypothetical protein